MIPCSYAGIVVTKRRRDVEKREKHVNGPVNAVGEVRAVALKDGGGGSFELLLDNGDTLTAFFQDKDEMIITQALRWHRNTRLKVSGPGTFDAAGKPQHLLHLKHCERVAISALRSEEKNQEKPSASSGQSILTMFEKIHKSAPKGTWDDVPTDGAKNYKHYLYGRPKVEDDG